jgi:hypothetical protein
MSLTARGRVFCHEAEKLGRGPVDIAGAAIARLHFPQREHIEHEGDDSGGLDHLDEAAGAEVLKRLAEHQRAHNHPKQAASHT